MTTIAIHDWNNLPKASWNALLLGNGASIALHSGFGYTSLHAIASQAGSLLSSSPIFQRLGTTDFEHVLLACWHADMVNNALGTPSPLISSAYAEVREALIAAISATHCSQASLGNSLQNIASFASAFDTVVMLNYDLTFYWAMQDFNSQNGRWFKDAFMQGAFDPNWQRFRTPYGATGTTMVFYAHGSLMLARDVTGQEVKIGAAGSALGGQSALLNTITRTWRSGSHVPLFVSEGTATEKLRSIRRSVYLASVYDQVISNLGDAVVVYGLSFAPNDQHVIDALKRSPPKLMAISVYGGLQPHEQQAFCLDVSAKLRRHLPWTQFEFFNSQSAGCWNNP